MALQLLQAFFIGLVCRNNYLLLEYCVVAVEQINKKIN